MAVTFALSATKNLFNMTLLTGIGEATGTFNKLPAGVGALIGVVNFAVTQALRPIWTAIQLSANFHPVGCLFFVIFAIVTECVISSLIISMTLPRIVNLQNTLITTAETCGAAAVVTMLLLAGFNALRA